MLKAFTHSLGQDIFIHNSYGYLVHRWTRISKKNFEEYKVIAEEVSCNPAILFIEPNYHIFFINYQMKLKNLQINVINTFLKNQFQITSQIEANADFLNVSINDKIIYVEALQNGKRVCFVNKITQRLAETNQQNYFLQTSKINEITEAWKQNYQLMPLESIPREIQINGKNQNQQKSLLSEIKFQDLENCFSCVLKLIEFIQKNLWKNNKLIIQFQNSFENKATLISINFCYFLLYLDRNQQLIRLPVYISQQNKIQIGESQSRPYLIWQEIQFKCTPLGVQGYHADCFHYKQQNIVIKKFRNYSKAFKSNREVNYLQKIQQIQPNLFHHDVISQGIITGFSMTFFQGQNWYQLTTNPDNILNRSPVARVQLVIKLGQFMRKLQEISFCHGDLHLQNILIQIQQQDLVYPRMSIKVIDFGNSFEIIQGETVSQGLTGFSPIVPPQVQFSYKKNYNPFGLNAYQFGRNSLCILLKNAQRNLCKLDYTPLRQLQSLKQNNQYPSDLYNLLRQLVHYRIDKRNDALQQNISYLEEQTRKIYLQKQKDK